MSASSPARDGTSDDWQTRVVLTPIAMMTDALATEARLLEEIVAILRRQRNAVSRDDLQGVDDSVFATHRVLVTLNEARRRRRAINVLLGEREELPIAQLDEILGDRAPQELLAARDELQRSARTLSREVAMNRGILRQALASGAAYVRALTGAPPDAVYSQRTGGPRGHGANLFDRRI